MSTESESTLTVTTSDRRGGKDENETIRVEKNPVTLNTDHPAEAWAAFGETIPKAEKFAFRRVDVGLRMPCDPAKHKETLEYVIKTTKDRLQKEIDGDDSEDINSLLGG